MKKLIAIAMMLAFLPLAVSATTVGLISDLHADKQKKRTNAHGQTVYPKKAKGMFKTALKNLEKQGVGIVIVAGDNTNKKKTKKKYVKNLRKYAKKSKVKVVWVKGNHDSRKNFKRLTHKKRTRYCKDYKDVRIIVLDSTKADGGGVGWLEPKQIDYLKEKLQTSRKVIVTFHHPIFDRGTKEVIPRYQEFKSIIEASGNVEAVITGHWHIEYQVNINGINYWTVPPLTSDGYRITNL